MTPIRGALSSEDGPGRVDDDERFPMTQHDGSTAHHILLARHYSYLRTTPTISRQPGPAKKAANTTAVPRAPSAVSTLCTSTFS